MIKEHLEKIVASLPSLLTAMITTAGFTAWALNFFESKEHSKEIIERVWHTEDEYHTDIKQIRQDLDFIKGELSKWK